MRTTFVADNLDAIRDHFFYDRGAGVLTTSRGAKGCLRPDGYRIFKFRKRLVFAHVIAYALTWGSVPKAITFVDGDKGNLKPENLKESV